MRDVRRTAVCVVLLCVAGCLRPRPAPEPDADATTSDGTFDAVVDAADVVVDTPDASVPDAVDVSVDMLPADAADVMEPPDVGMDASVDGPDADVPWPAYTERLDFELEFGCYIGALGKDIPRDEARGHIFGYTIFNDFSARDEQTKEMAGQLGGLG